MLNIIYLSNWLTTLKENNTIKATKTIDDIAIVLFFLLFSCPDNKVDEVDDDRSLKASNDLAERDPALAAGIF